MDNLTNPVKLLAHFDDFAQQVHMRSERLWAHWIPRHSGTSKVDFSAHGFVQRRRR